MAQDEHVAETLSWIQPRMLHEEFTLQRSGAAIGSLSFRSSWGTLATGTFGADTWTFKRLGFLRTRVTVRTSGSERDLATFHPGTWSGGGVLELPGGRQFKIDISFWHTRIEIIAPGNRPFLRYRPKGVFRQGADLDVLQGAQEVQELPWLMLFGWYLAVLLHRDAAAAAV